MDDVEDGDSNDENDGAWLVIFQALKACAEPAAQNLQRAIQWRVEREESLSCRIGKKTLRKPKGNFGA